MEKRPALPKNIRQIGEISGREKICVEDYVMTYIRKREPQEDKGFLGIFLGEQQETDDSVYVFIRGVFEIPEELQEQKDREVISKECGNYFGDWTVQGCCVIGTYPTERMKTLASWFPESGKLIYHLQEQEETLYWTGEEQYRRLNGYFVFYEQNQKMQEYLAQVFKDASVEKESAPDHAIRSFREKVKEKGEQKQGNFLRMASSFFVITVLIIGAIVVNRIEDIRAVRSLALLENRISAEQQEEGEDAQSSAVSGSRTWQAPEETTQPDTPDAAAETVQSGSSGTAAAAQPSGTPDTAADVPQSDISGTAAAAQPSDTPATAADVLPSDTPDTAAAASQSSASADAVQYNAIQRAAEEAELAGSDAFWEESGFEDSTEQQSDPQPDGQSGTQESGEAQEAAAIRHTQAGYVIKEGDTLAGICSRYYGTIDRVGEVCEANGIEDANMILPGQRIVLP